MLAALAAVSDCTPLTFTKVADDQTNTGADYNGNNAQTLLLDDIAVLQDLYGVNTTTRAGDTTDGFNSNVGGVYDFSTNGAPVLCIWDAGDNDTFDIDAGTIVIVGGSGIDSLVYDVYDYVDLVITSLGDSLYTIVSAAEGIFDTLSGIETLVFADRTLTIADTGTSAANDVDGDGSSDILWRATDGTLAVWQMSGSAVTSASFVTNPGTDWSVAGTGDYSGDGKDDILWYRETTGEYAVWVMDGPSITSSAVLSAAPGSAWNAVA